MTPNECECNCEPKCCTEENCNKENCQCKNKEEIKTVQFEPEFDITIH